MCPGPEIRTFFVFTGQLKRKVNFLFIILSGFCFNFSAIWERRNCSEIIWSFGRRRIRQRVNLVMQKDISVFRYPSKLWSAPTRGQG